MSADIGPGDWVECVRPSRMRPGALRVGAVYQVVSCTPEDRHGIPGVTIKGVPAVYEHAGFGWAVFMFRPVYRPKAEILDGLREPIKPVKTPVREGVPA